MAGEHFAVKGLLSSRAAPFTTLTLKGMRARGGEYTKISLISRALTAAEVGLGGVSNWGELIELMMSVFLLVGFVSCVFRVHASHMTHGPRTYLSTQPDRPPRKVWQS